MSKPPPGRVSTRSSQQTHYDPPMSFGKYKGSKVSSLPEDYLAWLVGEATIRDDGLREAIEAEWQRRKPKNVDMRIRTPSAAPTGKMQWWVFVPTANPEATSHVFGPWDTEVEAQQEASRIGSGAKVSGPWPSK